MSDSFLLNCRICDVCGESKIEDDIVSADDLEGVTRDICYACRNRHQIFRCESCYTWKRSDQFNGPNWLVCDDCGVRDAIRGA